MRRLLGRLVRGALVGAGVVPDPAKETARDYQIAVGGHWEQVGRSQFDYLLREGLRHDHYLLDVACGSFRVGRLLIDYLDEGHYFCFDRDQALLEAGKRDVLAPIGLMAKRPTLAVTELTPEGGDLRALMGRSF